MVQIGHKVSEATRQKIRDKLKGRKISEESRRKRIGRKLSPEHRRNIGLASKGKKHSEETKRKMRGRKHTDESRRKMSEARKGKKNPMYGKRHSEEHRRKISEANKGKKISEEHKKKLRLANIGKKPSEETRRKIGLAHLGKKLTEEHKRKIGRKGKLNKNYGKHLSEETKRKMSKALKGRSVWNKGKKGVQVGWNKGMKGVQVGWNKGLTKETDGRVRKISESRMGIKFSEKSKRKMVAARKKLFASGYQSPMKGKKQSEEARRKMSIARKGKKYAPGRIPGMLGKKASKETRRKLSLARTGYITRKETKRKIGAKNRMNYSTLERREFFRKKRLHQVFPIKDSKDERYMQKLLKNNGIKFVKHEPILGQPDIFIKPNICIFVDGDHFHANPKQYTANHIIWNERISKSTGKYTPPVTAKMIREKDSRVTKELRKQGYAVLRFWSSNMYAEPEKCVQKIKKAIKN